MVYLPVKSILAACLFAHLGWTPAANVAVIDTTPGTTKVTLDANALPLGGKTKLIKILSGRRSLFRRQCAFRERGGAHRRQGL